MVVEKLQENPMPKANVVSKLFFCWLGKLFAKGNKRELTADDLYRVLEEDESKRLGDRLKKTWDKELLANSNHDLDIGSQEELTKVNNGHLNIEHPAEKGIRDGGGQGRGRPRGKKKRPSLLRTLWKEFGLWYLFIGLLALIEECIFKLMQPFFLGYLLRYFSGNDGYTKRDGYLFAGGICLGAGLYTFTHHPYFFGVMHIGMQIRVAICSLIYRKALRLSNASLGRTNIGQMINLLSNDVNRFDQTPMFLPYLIVGPVMTVIVTVLLWQYFGYSCLTGLAVLILSIPFQGLMGRKFSKYRVQTAGKTDIRIRYMHEIISGIRVIKMYTWEKAFSALVNTSRENEVKVIKQTARLRAINFSIFFTSSKLIFFITLITYIYTDNLLTAEKVFVSLSLYNNIKLVMTLFFPYAVSQLAEALVSIKRLENFLLMEERDISATFTDIENGAAKEWDKSVVIQGLNVRWTPEGENTLTDISLQVKPGQLVAVIGHVGSGKSSLLQAILREVPLTRGTLRVNGQLAYACQESWIFAGSVRENILFGKEYDRPWYKKVIRACALEKDIELFPYGDKTLVGDRGTALSGGQKARINLARAVYANADIYLLDDPLSAVDAEVGRHLFEYCIGPEGILGSKARILVTHQLSFIKFVDHILLLKDGRIQVEGNYEELISEKGINFAQMLRNDEKEEEDDELSSDLEVVPEEGYESDGQPTASPSRRLPGIRKRIKHASESESLRKESVDLAFDPKTEEEQTQVGSIKIGLIGSYFRSGSSILTLFLLIFSNFLVQLFYTGSDFWLNIWTKEEEARADNNTVPERDPDDPWYKIYHDRDTQVIIYAAFIFALFIGSLWRSFTFFEATLNSSMALHKQMFQGIIRAPMKFFEQNPIGRVLNRFSKDTGQIDDLLPTTFYDAMEIFMNILGIIVVTSIVNPFLLIPTAILTVLFYFLRGFYIKTGRSIKRIEGLSRSPVFSHLSTSLYGLTTIRAFKAEDKFVVRFDDLQDFHSSAWFLFLSTTRWFGIRLDWISVFFLSIVTFSFMIFAPDGGTEVGLAISSSIMLTGMFQWGVRQSAELENQFVSVERVLDYTKIESEANLESEKDKKPPNGWPDRGEIVMSNVMLRYSEDAKPVLKDVTITIKPCEKVGIVGRTGAGKSSLLTILFRIAEPTGVIEIDGINVLKIGLHDLRSKVSIIPQDPVMFTGSLRRNLDPFNNFSDAELWSVLAEVHLAQEVRSNPAGLDGEVAEGGSNYSVGQRQLICLGRAILKRNKILVLDEATASVDPETDALIQKTIRAKFSDCTVLTIAHRLHTVMDSDRILVLDAGQVKEFDEPFTLLQNGRSALSMLVDQTGKGTADNLLNIAKEAHEKRNQLVVH